MARKTKLFVKRNVAGYKDAQGRFHPIRASRYYDPGEVLSYSDEGEPEWWTGRKRGKAWSYTTRRGRRVKYPNPLPNPLPMQWVHGASVRRTPSGDVQVIVPVRRLRRKARRNVRRRRR